MRKKKTAGGRVRSLTLSLTIRGHDQSIWLLSARGPGGGGLSRGRAPPPGQGWMACFPAGDWGEGGRRVRGGAARSRQGQGVRKTTTASRGEEGGGVEPLCCVRTTPLESLQERKAKTSRSPPSIIMLESEALRSATRHAARHAMPPAMPPGMSPDMSPSMEYSPPAMPPGMPLGTSPGMPPGMSPTR